MRGMNDKVHDVFLAFGGADRPVATAVSAELGRMGWAAFCDADLAPGAHALRDLEAAMASSRAVVLLQPREDRRSPWLDHEQGWSLTASAAGTVLFIPMRVADQPPRTTGVYGTSQLVWADWWDDDAERTALAVDAALRHPAHRRWFVAVPPEPRAEEAATRALLRAHLHLDRVAQWGKLRDLCQQPRPALLLVHGPPDQHVDGFLERVRRHLVEDVQHHEVVVVSTDGLYESGVTVDGWHGRVMEALDTEDAVLDLRRRAKTRHVILVFGSRPVRPGRFTKADEGSWEAFIQWVAERLPELVAASGSKRPLRVLLAVEERGGAWTERLEGSFCTFLDRLDLPHAPLKRLSFPSYDEVLDYVDLLGRKTTPGWMEALRARYLEIEAGTKDYRQLADAIEELVEELLGRSKK